MKAGKKQTVKLTELLPLQAHYWMLHDGNKFAEHGPTKNNHAPLVFATEAKCHAFVKVIGQGLPQFKPTRVPFEDFARKVIDEGQRFCMMEGLSLIMCGPIHSDDPWIEEAIAKRRKEGGQ